jgi:alkylation response protein AidB-like acyl-CoA dehydrogenase
MLSGDSGFNEMFFTNVRVPSKYVIGEVNDGWNVAITALANERANLGTGLYVVFKRNLDAMIEQARKLKRGGRPVIADPVVRQRLAQAYVDLEVLRLNTTRSLSMLNKTGAPGPEGSIQKLYWSELNQRMAQIAMEVLGPYGQLANYDNGRWAYMYLRSRGNTIEAGTSEVQRNIIAQRVLGLPRTY